MKHAVIQFSNIGLSPVSRLDPRFWLRVTDRAKQEGVKMSDRPAVRRIVLTEEAYERMGLRELQARAATHTDNLLKGTAT